MKQLYTKHTNTHTHTHTCSLQAKFHSIITLSFDCHWLPLLARRLGVLFPQVSLDAASAATCFKKMIGHASTTLKMIGIRTLCNSWVTSSRFHEAVLLPCIFGCGCLGPLLPGNSCKDYLTHYLSCSRLWDVVAFVSGSPVRSPPPVRLGILPLPVESLPLSL